MIILIFYHHAILQYLDDTNYTELLPNHHTRTHACTDAHAHTHARARTHRVYYSPTIQLLSLGTMHV